MSYIGTNKVGKMYLGDTAIGKAYLGDDLVYDSAGGSVTPALPYDAEVEYLQSSGTQYIDTGIVGNQNTKIEAKFYPTQLDTFVYGCRGDNTNSITYFVGSNDNERFGNQTYLASSTANTLYVVIQDKTKVSINGVDHNYGTVSNFTTPYNLYLFGASGTEYALSHLFIGRIYYMKIWSGDTLVRDFIPVRVGQVGYMYDKVNGQLFGNGGTGSFILGNDKSNEPQPESYVQDNLVFNLDGIDRGGTTGHWIDLVGGVDFTLNGCTELTDHVSFGGTGYGLTDSNLNFSLDNHTIELVIAPNFTTPSSSSVVFITSNQRNVAFAYTTSRINVQGGTQSGTTVRNTFAITKPTNIIHFIISQGIGYYAFVNGLSITTGSIDYFTAGDKASIGCRMRNGSITNKFDGSIYAIRIYQGDLSEVQRMNNLAVDNQRFNMGLTL